MTSEHSKDADSKRPFALPSRLPQGLERLVSCDEARPLLGPYHDGELDDHDASLLRRHLIACSPCRALAQDLEAIGHWFVPTPAVAVPTGFAARVARRAIGGDSGRGSEPVATPVTTASSRSGDGDATRRAGGTLLRFVLFATAAAAAVLLVLSGFLSQAARPAVEELKADGGTLTETLERLDELNRVEDPSPASPPESGSSESTEQGRER